MGQATRVPIAYDDGLSRCLVKFLESQPFNMAILRCGDCFPTTKQINESLPDSSVVTLIESEEEPDIGSAVRARATGYVPRDMAAIILSIPSNCLATMIRALGGWRDHGARS